MDINEQKDAVVKKSSELWTKFGKYVYIGVGVLAFIIGAVYVGQWYAAGKADELAKSIYQKWTSDNREVFEQITRNKLKIEELDQNFQSQSETLRRMRSGGGKVIDVAIQKGDTAIIAGMFDNLVDRYTPPASWDK